MVSAGFLRQHTSRRPYEFLCLFIIIGVLAWQELLRERVTERSITVSYSPEEGVTDSQIMAKHSKVGRFFGTCDTRACTVDGLSPGFIYDIWVRTCSGSGPTQCILRAMPAQMATNVEGRCYSMINVLVGFLRPRLNYLDYSSSN